MTKIKQLLEDEVPFYPVTAPEAIQFSDGDSFVDKNYVTQPELRGKEFVIAKALNNLNDKIEDSNANLKQLETTIESGFEDVNEDIASIENAKLWKVGTGSNSAEFIERGVAIGDGSISAGGIAYGNNSRSDGVYSAGASLNLTGDANATTYSLGGTYSGNVDLVRIGDVVKCGTKYATVTAVDTSSSPSTITFNKTLSDSTLSSASAYVQQGISIGSFSHVEGSACIAIGSYSHAEGNKTFTYNNYEHAEGSYNTSTKNKTIYSIGVGTGESARANAIEVWNTGEVFIKDIGTYDGTNPISGTNDVVTIINSLVSRIQALEAYHQ